MAAKGELPKGMFIFSQLEISKPQRNQLIVMVLIISAIGLIGTLLAIYLGITIWISVLLIAILSLISLLIIPDQIAIIKTPLAVNMNHPFVDDEPIGKATVFLRLSNDHWVEVGLERLRLVRDELVGGFNIVEDNDNYSLVGHFSNSKNIKITQIQITLINQALALRDVVNEEEDPIEDARLRETQDSVLLDREWLELENLEIEGPISKLINRNE